MSNFNFSYLLQLPSPPTPLSLEVRVTRLEDTVTRGFRHMEEQPLEIMEMLKF